MIDRQDTDTTSRSLYLDHAAATPVDQQVLEAMLPYYSDNFYNPSAVYSAAKRVRQNIDQARGTVAGYLGARPAEIIFTAGGSEANNLAINGVMRSRPGATMIISPIEHDSVLATGAQYETAFLPVDEQGIVDPNGLYDVVTDETLLVSIMYANNEIGTVQPIRELGTMVAAIRRDRQKRRVTQPLYLHVDASQAANYLGLQTARLGVDLMTLNGGKIYGPKQSGVLYVRAGIVLEPVVRGGGQERGLRSGTENVPAIIGFAKALQIAQDSRQDEGRRLQELQADFFKKLPDYVPATTINGSLKHRLPNNLHITIPGTDNERLIFALDEAGIMAAAGSACSASSDTPSHVLGALGLSDEVARSSLRFTMGRGTTETDIARLLHTLQSLVG